MMTKKAFSMANQNNSFTESTPLDRWGRFLATPPLIRPISSESKQTQNQEDDSQKKKEQIWQHITSLSQLGDNHSDCQLCGESTLYFATEMSCSSCNASINDNEEYYNYISDKDLPQIPFCSECVHNSHLKLRVKGKIISKSKLWKKTHDRVEESFVCCDKCGNWQHQICGLYNKKEDENGVDKYLCPKCILAEMESGKYLPNSTNMAIFNAKDLKKTTLSNHIEHRVLLCLNKDREMREEIAQAFGDEVAEVGDICVRVVLCKKENLQVKEELLNVLHGTDYVGNFPYTTKLILMFQKVNGIDVCVFCMYVQEYGSECSHPNQRSAYISYIDSVKYFQPALLRTTIYHEILIGYLDYIKKRGFTTCYLWACPPQDGNDYIFNCHPPTQKMPKPERLREWYHTMIIQAAKEGIVMNRTTFYHRFFERVRELNEKMTMTSLPYFDGDYWPSAVEKYIHEIENECLEDFSELDAMLMQKLEEVFSANREDFMVMDLQPVCSVCRSPFSSGKYWSHSDLTKSRLCQRCHDLEINITCKREIDLSYPVSINAPLPTKDEDDAMENKMFNTRKEFLSHCTEENYQFDTLRRAKHSSMMILYNLRHLTQPTQTSTYCHICHKETQSRRSWTCKICPTLTLCNACHQQHGSSCHIHALTTPRSHITGVALKPEERDKMLKSLHHANCCPVPEASKCSYPICHILKTMFVHASTCTVFPKVDCKMCHKVWYALRCHSAQCTDDRYCKIPHCNLLKRQAALELRKKSLN